MERKQEAGHVGISLDSLNSGVRGRQTAVSSRYTSRKRSEEYGVGSPEENDVLEPSESHARETVECY